MAVFSKNVMFRSAEAAAATPASVEKIESYFRFFGDNGELYWSFIGYPSDNCLNMTCKALRMPNYEEVDIFEFRKGYRH